MFNYSDFNEKLENALVFNMNRNSAYTVLVDFGKWVKECGFEGDIHDMETYPQFYEFFVKILHIYYPRYII